MELSIRAKVILTAATLTGVFITMLVLWLCLGQSVIFFILTGISLAGIILSISIWVLIQHHRRRRLSLSSRTPDGTDLRLEYSFLRKVAGLPAKFRYQDLQLATDDFQSLLGRGASASVFKGILDDGTPVAVKRIELGAEQADREFRSEVSAIASVQHVNLVRMLGYCLVPNGTRFLVYDYVPNGSLDKWIFRPKDKEEDSTPCLPWPLRYKVAIEVAKALAYLHQDCRSRVLHLDIKPENILLDDGFRAVVSDFGLSKLMNRDQSRIVTTIRGTRGYLAPEWFLENGVSEKSDVYSYGMVLMELVGGRRNVMVIGDERRWSYFPKVVAEKVREGKFMEVVDERVLRGGVEEREVRALACVALWCAQEEPKLRPSMARVVDMLEGRICVETPPETDMIMLDLLSMDAISNINPARLISQADPDPDVGGSLVTCSFSFLSGR